jgi:DnaJ-class molecular chaperone
MKQQCQTVLDADGRYFGLLTNPMEEETMRQSMVKDPCAYCGGTGASRCNHCGGTGINENSSLLHDQCHGCKGTGRERCQSCRGTGEWRPVGIAASQED